MLDSDLADLYDVETFNLNKAVKRNIGRFPVDFMFQLTKEEWENLKFKMEYQVNSMGADVLCLTFLQNKALQCWRLFLIAKKR